MTLINRAASRLLKIAPAEVEGRHYSQLVPELAGLIRRAMTEAKVRVDDRRVRFVGVEAYAEAGGEVLRDIEKACAKLGVRTRIEAVAVGVRTGIIDPEDE